ncbi:MAG: hypothetical protein AAF529_24290 [Pseudomonadota bacterium]
MTGTHTLGQTDDAAFAGLRFPHVLQQDQARWLRGLHSVLQPGARVLKNFPTPARLCELLGAQVVDLAFEQLTHYWLLSYTLRAA